MPVRRRADRHLGRGRDLRAACRTQGHDECPIPQGLRRQDPAGPAGPGGGRRLRRRHHPYGYDVVPSLERRGERRVNEAQATVVRRIFEEYGDGVSPKRIALKLNQDGIAGARGGAWASTMINGNRDRGTGILNNELYVGRLVWNRLRYSKDPDSGGPGRTTPPRSSRPKCRTCASSARSSGRVLAPARNA